MIEIGVVDDQAPYPGPDESTPFDDLRDLITSMAKAYGRTAEQFSEAMKNVTQGFTPILYTMEEVTKYADKIQELQQKKKQNHGPRPKRQFDHRGRRKF